MLFLVCVRGRGGACSDRCEAIEAETARAGIGDSVPTEPNQHHSSQNWLGLLVTEYIVIRSIGKSLDFHCGGVYGRGGRRAWGSCVTRYITNVALWSHQTNLLGKLIKNNPVSARPHNIDHYRSGKKFEMRGARQGFRAHKGRYVA